jgi:hypothetical protein
MIAAVVLVSLAGLYSVSTVGVTGGPNHGEHPMTVSIVHLVCFFIFARGWPALSYYSYLGGLLAALAASMAALTFDAVSRPRVQWTIRAVIAVVYGGLLWILVARP